MEESSLARAALVRADGAVALQRLVALGVLLSLPGVATLTAREVYFSHRCCEESSEL